MSNILNKSLIKQAILSAQANQRQTNSQVKTRGEVRGGGRKPYKQKGTGQARAGTRRSPIWVGGGITFGPDRLRHYKTVMPVKMKRMAIAQVLEHLNDHKLITVVDKISLAQPKTKLAIKLLQDHKLEGKKVLIVTENIEPELVVAVRNIPNVEVIENKNISILDIAHVKAILIDKKSAEIRGLVKTEKKVVEKKPAAKKTVVKEETK